MRKVFVVALLAVGAAAFLYLRNDDQRVANAEDPPDGTVQNATVDQTSPPVNNHGQIQYPATGNTTNFTYKITPKRKWSGGKWIVEDDDKICDFHLFFPVEDGKGRTKPMPKKKMPKKKNVTAPAGWTVKNEKIGKGNALGFYSDDCDTPIPPEGLTVSIKVKKGTKGWPSVYTLAVVATGNGNAPEDDSGGGYTDFPTGEGPISGGNVVYYWPTIDRPKPEGYDDDSDPPPVTGPVYSMLVDTPKSDLVLASGDSLQLSVPEVWEFAAVKVHTSTELDTDDEDPTGTGIKATSNPVPASWTITVTPDEAPFTPGNPLPIDISRGAGGPPIGDIYVVVEHRDATTLETIEMSRVIHVRAVTSAADYDGDGALNEVDGARFDPAGQ